MENYIIANCTDTGRVRQVNEDCMATFDSPNGRVVVVCDGMGGQNAGDVASQLAVTVIHDILTDNTFNTVEQAITSSVMAANQAILHRANQNPGLSGMGSTCVMLIIKDGMVYYGSVGDSRIYYISDGAIRQITKDQSYVQTLVDAGEISQEDAEHHHDKNQITNALGVEGMTPPVIGQLPITPTPGSIFLLCSDGLSGMINNSSINAIASDSSMSLQERAQTLVKRANEAGGVDNITVQLVEFPAEVAAVSPAMSVYPAPEAAAISKKAEVHKNRAMTYTIIAILLVVLGGGSIAYFLINGGKEPVPKTKTKTEQTQTVKKQPPATQSATTAPTPEPTVEQEIVYKEAPASNKTSSKESTKKIRNSTNNSNPSGQSNIDEVIGNKPPKEDVTPVIRKNNYANSEEK